MREPLINPRNLGFEVRNRFTYSLSPYIPIEHHAAEAALIPPDQPPPRLAGQGQALGDPGERPVRIGVLSPARSDRLESGRGGTRIDQRPGEELVVLLRPGVVQALQLDDEWIEEDRCHL